MLADKAQKTFPDKDHMVLARRWASGGGGRGQCLEANNCSEGSFQWGRGGAGCRHPGGAGWALCSSPGLDVGQAALLRDRELVTYRVPEQVLELRDMGLARAGPSLTYTPCTLGQHHVGPVCPRRWGAFVPQKGNGSRGASSGRAG